MDLKTLTIGFLEAEGYSVTEKPKGLLIGDRKAVGEDAESMLVWIPGPYDPERFERLEGPLLADFEEAGAKNPSARRFLLVPSTEGIRPEFRVGAKRWHNVNIRVPAQFFDTSFSWEESREASTAARQLRDRGEDVLKTRAPQPYQLEGQGSDSGGPDLLEVLFQNLRRPSSGKTVHVVIGPAGMGKSHLFTGLFARLLRAFQEDKQAQVLSPRPMPLLPEYLAQAEGATLRSLLRAFLQTDFARPLTPEVFEWRMGNKLGTWLLDGLDEVIIRDPEFFGYLEDLMTRPAFQPPSMLICVRDALVSSNENVREFCQDFSGSVEVYRLSEWGTRSKEHLASIRLKGEAPRFLEMLREQPTLNDLGSTPYYCELLVAEYEEGTLRPDVSEVELVGRALDRIIDREYAKELVSKAAISPEGVRAFLEATAADDFEGGFEGVSVESAREWAQLALPHDLRKDELDALVQQMTQFAVFMYGGLGSLRFSEEVLEHYLIGAWLAGLLEKPVVFAQRLGIRHIPPDWLTLRVVAERVRAHGKRQSVLNVVHQCQANPVSCRNGFQLAALTADSPEGLRGLSFERHDLSGIVFEDLDFQDQSFRAADLSETEFRACNLKGANFEDAILNNTRFALTSTALQGAEFGEMTRFYSMRVNGSTMADPGEAKKWLAERTGRPPRMREPCTPAQQLRHLFGKFVYPTGQARRKVNSRNALIKGKRIHHPERILEAAIKHGYLVEGDFRGRVSRPEGDAYAEMVAFVADLKLSRGITRLLDDVDPDSTCQHVPETP